VIRIKLSTVLDAGPGAIGAMSGRIARSEVILDGSGVDTLAPEQLEFLLADIPPSWDTAELGEVIDAPTLSPNLGTQLLTWLDRRHGRDQGSGTRVQGSGSQAQDIEVASGDPIPDPGSRIPEPKSRIPEPRPPILRDQLEDLLVRQILGPWDGPEELVAEPSVRGRYLVGMLAPRGGSALPEAYDDGDLGGSDSEDGTPDAPPPKAATAMLPSSIGLTCSVAPDALEISVSAGWGHYARTEIREERFKRSDGSYTRPWKRTPVAVTLPPIALRQGKVGPIEISPEHPGVMLQGMIRQRLGEWIVTLFLVNGQSEQKRSPDSTWVFQPRLAIQATDGSAIFRRRPLPGDQHDLEDQLMAMLYRREVEFAVGHGVAVQANLAHTTDGHVIHDRAVALFTTVIPTYDVPQTTPPTPADPGFEQLADLTLDMAELARIPSGAFATYLAPLTDAYAGWIEHQETRLQAPTPDLQPFVMAGNEAMRRCRTALERIQAGIALLDRDEQAAEAFRFANRAMALQRTRSLYAAAVRRGEKRTPNDFDRPDDHSWRAFQLGFLLLNLPALSDPRHPERVMPATDSQTDPAAAIADLLWFPTGGGKTEAYLGLTAFTLAIRRLQGEIGGRSGLSGVAVLMRYTLRLLTLQQFQRAATLICACEVIRREDEARWGAEPFRIGLWVGQRSTPNWVSDADEAIKQLRKGGMAGGGTPHQLKHCPWCGTPIDPGRNLVAELPEKGRSRVLTYCGSLMNHCPFNARQADGEGLPVMVVDEEIYQRLPALLIATVDKFAQMPWNGRVAALFGQVDRVCERHGFLTPDSDHPAQSHPQIRNSRHGPARVLPVPPLRPPDLIIQDELHLISGPLGTLVGLYESAVDQLAGWDLDGTRIRPKVVASTATIRRAEQQMHSLFLRHVEIFPPQGLDAGDNFFALQRPTSPDYPGRRYLGICAPGIRHKTALIQSYVALLAAAQQLYEHATHEADPYMTLVGYFNALRELAAMRRAVDDTVSTRLKKMRQRGLPERYLDPWSVTELTSRLSAGEIPDILDRLETPFETNQRPERGKRSREQFPVNVLLATNMISVGVDVGRLGMMVVAGQPKSTAEYIQATSRVGRRHPGLIATVYNWARPRDLSHYERFRHYHATFYQYVEALSVTPFSPRALDRGLSGVLVALTRLADFEYNPQPGGRTDQARRSHDCGCRRRHHPAEPKRSTAPAGPG
jgi:hypothetical protein